MPGSLVVLSFDYFRTFFVGIIKMRDVILMNKTHKKDGYVPINIEIVKTNVGEMDIIDIINKYGNEQFHMIESSAYFESYVHVLRSLQTMNTWDILPFE
jgi:hypothetical protein